MVQAPWHLSSNEQQQAVLQGAQNKAVVEVRYKNTLQGIPEVIQLKGCVVQGICEGQHNRDPGGFLGVMALLEQRVGLQWRLLLMCPACIGARKCYMAMGCQGNPVGQEVRKHSLRYPFALSSDFAPSFF